MPSHRKFSFVWIVLIAAFILVLSQSQILSLPESGQPAKCCAIVCTGCVQHCQKSCCQKASQSCKKCGKDCCKQSQEKCEAACCKG